MADHLCGSNHKLAGGERHLAPYHVGIAECVHASSLGVRTQIMLIHVTLRHGSLPASGVGLSLHTRCAHDKALLPCNFLCRERALDGHCQIGHRAERSPPAPSPVPDSLCATDETHS